MSAALQFPIVCYNDEDMNGIVAMVTKWLLNNQRFHFNALTHLNTECGLHKSLARSGQHPTIKVIYIAPGLRQAARIILNQLKAHFPESKDDEISDEEEQSDQEGRLKHRVVMMCPVCGIPFGEQ